MNEYPIPNGFRSIFKDFAREVLRSQPKDLLIFAATYFRVRAQKIHLTFQTLNNGIEWTQESEYKRFIDSGEAIPGNVRFPR